MRFVCRIRELFTLQRMEADRHIHKTRNGTFHITGPGEHFLTGSLVDLDSSSGRLQSARR
jgi:hypothetical protein